MDRASTLMLSSHRSEAPACFPTTVSCFPFPSPRQEHSTGYSEPAAIYSWPGNCLAPPILSSSWLGPSIACTVQLQRGSRLASLAPSSRNQPCLGEGAPLPTQDTIWGASPLPLPTRSGEGNPIQPGGLLSHHHCCAVTWLCRTHCTLGTWRGCRICSPHTAQLTCCWRAEQLSLAGAATRGVRSCWGLGGLRWERG